MKFKHYFTIITTVMILIMVVAIAGCGMSSDSKPSMQETVFEYDVEEYQDSLWASYTEEEKEVACLATTIKTIDHPEDVQQGLDYLAETYCK